MKKEEIKIVVLASFLMLVCIVAASADSTLRFIDPTPADNTQEQDFTWGVLAINTHKSIYLPDETASIGIAVLDNGGHMICDADVTLTITDPGNNETVLSTSNGLIKVSPQCCVYGVTNLPDYYTNYAVDGAGTYVMNLTAVTTDGTKSITDEFTVQNSVDFDVARDGPTRIYPPVPYVMNFTIKANKNYTGLIKEYVPASFEITPQRGLTVTTAGDTKVLTWNKNLVKGENHNIYYEFDAPDVSPYLFLLGRLQIGSFEEIRDWMVASDAPDVETLTAVYAYGVGTTPSGDVTSEIQEYGGSSTVTLPDGSANYVWANYTSIDASSVSAVTTLWRVNVGADQDGFRFEYSTNDGESFSACSGCDASVTTGQYINYTCDLYANCGIDTPGEVNGLAVKIWIFDEKKPGSDSTVDYSEVSVTYTPATWESYNDSAHNYPDDTFSGDEHTVYMHGTGFAVSHGYKVAYYDAGKYKVATEFTNTSESNGNLSSQYYFPTNTSATAGIWHSAVYDATGSPPSTYNPVDPDMIIADSFTVEHSAIPEFQTVIAAIAVCMLCAVAYVVMRRKAGKR